MSQLKWIKTWSMVGSRIDIYLFIWLYIYICLGCGRTKPLATLPHCQITTLPPPPPSQPPPPSSAAPIEKVSVPSIPACSHENINRKISKVIILNLKWLIQTQAGQNILLGGRLTVGPGSSFAGSRRARSAFGQTCEQDSSQYPLVMTNIAIENDHL